MNKNVMCVTVCGNTTNIGFYDVELSGNSIRYLKLDRYQTEVNLKINEISKLILDIQYIMSLDLIIIDRRGMGIAVADELESKKCRVPIYRSLVNKQIINEALIKASDLLKEKLLDVDKKVDIDLNKFNITYNSDCTNITLLKSDYDDVFSNICLLLGFGNKAISDIFKTDKRDKIENNLKEILLILVDDLHNLSYLDTKEIEKLTRLIDKVNYIRGQY